MSEAVAGLVGALIGAVASLGGVYLTEWLRDRRTRRALKRLFVSEMNDNLISAEMLRKNGRWPYGEGQLFEDVIWSAHRESAAMLLKASLWRPVADSYDHVERLENLNRMAQQEDAPKIVREFGHVEALDVKTMIETTRKAVKLLGGEPPLSHAEIAKLAKRYGLSDHESAGNLIVPFTRQSGGDLILLDGTAVRGAPPLREEERELAMFVSPRTSLRWTSRMAKARQADPLGAHSRHGADDSSASAS